MQGFHTNRILNSENSLASDIYPDNEIIEIDSAKGQIFVNMLCHS